MIAGLCIAFQPSSRHFQPCLWELLESAAPEPCPQPRPPGAANHDWKSSGLRIHTAIGSRRETDATDRRNTAAKVNLSRLSSCSATQPHGAIEVPENGRAESILHACASARLPLRRSTSTLSAVLGLVGSKAEDTEVPPLTRPRNRHRAWLSVQARVIGQCCTYRSISNTDKQEPRARPRASGGGCSRASIMPLASKPRTPSGNHRQQKLSWPPGHIPASPPRGQARASKDPATSWRR